MATILILGVKVPFTKGGQEVLVRTLVEELASRGHDVDIIELPYLVEPKETLLTQAAMWRALDLRKFSGKKVDLLIATKFPSYYARHPRKSLWLVHQHRSIYDLYGTRYADFTDDPRDEELRDMLMSGDKQVIGECAYVAGISRNVVTRLKNFNGIDGEVLYPPLPHGGKYRTAESENYILSVGRLCTIKRVDLIIRALPVIHEFIKIKIVGTPDESGIMEFYEEQMDKLGVRHRVEFLGGVDDETLLDLYARAKLVFYAPYNEDYGYVTLEAFASGKPVITATDSGGVLEFVSDGENGLVIEPEADIFGKRINELLADDATLEQMGDRGREFIEKEGFSISGWDRVVESLLSPLTT